MGDSLSKFLAAIWSDWWVLMTGLASLVVPVIAYSVGADEKELWWAIAYFLLIVAAFRLWKLEYQQPGPQVVLVYETRSQKRPEDMSFKEYEGWRSSGGGGKAEMVIPVLLENITEIVAFDAKIADVVLPIKTEDAVQVTATFPPVPKVVKGHPVEVQATIEQFGPLLCHDFGAFLKAAWDSKNSLDALKVPVTVSYNTIQGKGFETLCEIEYDFYVISTRTKGYRQVSRVPKWLARWRVKGISTKQQR